MLKEYFEYVCKRQLVLKYLKFLMNLKYLKFLLYR
jgi:hypothetical protein